MKYQKGNYTVNRQSKEDGQLMKNYKNIVTNIDKNRDKNRRVQSAFLFFFQQINYIYLPCRIEKSEKASAGAPAGRNVYTPVLPWVQNVTGVYSIPANTKAGMHGKKVYDQRGPEQDAK